MAARGQNPFPYQHVTEVVRARAEAAGLGVLGAAGARVQAVRGHASHAVKLGQEVCSHALRLGGQVARRLSDDAAEGAAGHPQHWRNKMGEQSAAILEKLGEPLQNCGVTEALKWENSCLCTSKSRICFVCRPAESTWQHKFVQRNEVPSFPAEQPARDTCPRNLHSRFSSLQ